MSAPKESKASLAHRLLEACSQGDIPAARAAMADGAEVNACEKFMPLPLVGAVMHNQLAAVAWLLSRGARPDSAMCQGVYAGTTQVLQLLMDAGGDVNRHSDGRTPLAWAVKGPSVHNVLLLLAQPRLDLTAASGDGKTPAQLARDSGKAGVADAITAEVGAAVTP